MTMNVRIRGDGVAARCCAHLLSQAGFGVSFEPGSRPRVPAIMLGEAAQRLMRDIFQRDDLFRDLPRITKRIVKWGAEPVELEHSAVVVSEEYLLNSLEPASLKQRHADWTIYAAAPLPASTTEHRFGSRVAAPMGVELKAGARTDACWIEAVEDGWLFLNSGWLLAVGSLEKSTIIKEQIARVDSATVSFSASPRMVAPLGGDGWIACGSAAMAFDPLCGDGAAHAVREAILASAVIRAVARGDDPGPLLAHYEARLIAGFQRHLALCRQFYLSGGDGPWWRAEAEATVRGIEWCGGRLEGHGRFRYQLHGLELSVV
ncbi:MAG: hypothetical protein ABSF22_22705 [Bryobacteraceae bacterium]